MFYALGTIGDDPAVVAHSNKLVQQYMKDPASVDGTLIRAAVKVAARHGDAELYAQYKAQLGKKLSPEAYYMFFYGLAAFPNADLAQQTLQWSLTPEVRGQDMRIVANLVDNPDTRNPAWEFVQQHFDDISKKTGGGLGGVGVFADAVTSLCDARDRDEVVAVLSAASDGGNGKRPEGSR